MTDEQTFPAWRRWYGERIDELRQRWENNESEGQIARAMGTTRNAIAGALHRLLNNGVELRHEIPVPKPFRERKIRIRKPAPPQPRKQPIAELMAKISADLDRTAARPCSVLELTDDTCRWPYGDPPDRDFHFCGGSTEPGFPYCPYHCVRAYHPSNPKYV